MCSTNDGTSCIGYFTRRRLTLLTVGTRFLLMGFEYAIILPTLALFLQEMAGNPISDYCQDSYSLNVGLVLSAMSFSALFSAPIFGRFSDKTRSTKTAVIIGNMCEIGGSIMYSFSRNPYVLIGSRLIAGIGIGPAASILGMISRATTKENRTSTISLVYSLRQVGVIIGPGFNLILREPIFHFRIGYFNINQYTLPTFFMAILWVIHTVMVIFLYDDLPSLLDENSTTSNELAEQAETSVNRHSDDFEEINKKSKSFYDMFKDILTSEGVACLTTILVSFTVQLGIEAVITPLTCRYFYWTGFENSIYFLASGILYVVSLIMVSKLSYKTSDENLTIVGTAAMVINSIFFLFFSIFVSGQPPEKPWIFAIFYIYGGILALFFSYTFTPVVSLISKISSEENQGFNQGLQVLCMRIGMILGPIWTTSMVDNYLTTMSAVNLTISMIPLIMFVASYKKFKIYQTYRTIE